MAIVAGLQNWVNDVRNVTEDEYWLRHPSVRPDCPTARMELGSHWTDFHEI